MKIHYLTIILFSIILLTSCKEEDISNGQVTATLMGDKVSVLNNSDETVYYFLIDENTLAHILWTPSVNEDTPKMAPRGQARVSIESITGYSSDTETVVICYWTAFKKEKELRAGPVNYLKIAL